MKKISYIFLAVLCSGACTRYVRLEPEPVDTGCMTTVVSNIESLLLGDDLRVWPSGAYIGVYGSEKGNNEKYVLRKADEGLNVAEFYGPNVKGDVISAYFPYDASYGGSADSMPVNLPVEQNHDSANSAGEQFLACCPAAYAFLSEGTMDFRYPFGMMKVCVALDETLYIDSISLTSAEGKIAGLGRIMPERGLVMGESSSAGVRLRCGGTASRNGTEVTEFHIVAAPGMYPLLTLTIDARDEEFPIVCVLRDVEIPRISAVDFRLASVVVRGDALSGFESRDVEFD